MAAEVSCLGEKTDENKMRYVKFIV